MPLTSDSPLHVHQVKKIYDVPPGHRHPEFVHILPQMGLMHTSMAMFGVGKYIGFDATFDDLMDNTGLSRGPQQCFREAKDFKTNLRFFV